MYVWHLLATSLFVVTLFLPNRIVPNICLFVPTYLHTSFHETLLGIGIHLYVSLKCEPNLSFESCNIQCQSYKYAHFQNVPIPRIMVGQRNCISITNLQIGLHIHNHAGHCFDLRPHFCMRCLHTWLKWQFDVQAAPEMTTVGPIRSNLLPTPRRLCNARCLSVCLSVCLFVCLSVCLSVC